MNFQPLNFRPLSLGSSSNKSPRLFRSNALNDSDSRAVQWLREEIGVKCYVDLREKEECRRPSKLDDYYVEVPPHEKKKHLNHEGTPLQDYGHRYRIGYVNFSYVFKFTLYKLNWSEIWKMILLLFQHLIYRDNEYQMHGGRCYFHKRNLGDFYCHLLDDCTKIYKKIFHLMTDSNNFPMLVGCSFGKDRTGIVSALIMSLAGCSEMEIIDDYCKSEINLLPLKRQVEKSFENKGIGKNFCGSPPEAIMELLLHVNTKYGSTEGYLRCCGLTQKEIEQIKRNIMGQ